jgi:hypothetical protein
MAPPAGERAALKKNRRTYAGAVVKAEFLNIKEQRFNRHIYIIILTFWKMSRKCPFFLTFMPIFLILIIFFLILITFIS